MTAMAAKRSQRADEAATVLALVEVPRVLREQLGISTTYWQVYRTIIDGRVPASRRGRIWLIARADLPRVAEALASRAA